MEFDTKIDPKGNFYPKPHIRIQLHIRVEIKTWTPWIHRIVVNSVSEIVKKIISTKTVIVTLTKDPLKKIFLFLFLSL